MLAEPGGQKGCGSFIPAVKVFSMKKEKKRKSNFDKEREQEEQEEGEEEQEGEVKVSCCIVCVAHQLMVRGEFA